MGKRRRVDETRGSNKRRPAVVGGMAAVVLGGAAFGVYALYGGGAAAESGTAASSADSKPKIKTGPLTPAEVTSASTAFLTSWQQGKLPQAAAATDDAKAATALLTAYAKDARITGVTLTPGAAAGAKVPFAVKGMVSFEGVSKPLAYASALTVVRSTTTGEPEVDWHASVVHPDLADGDSLLTGESGTPPVKALDRDGKELTSKAYPSLASVLDGLREKYGKKAGGKAGVELRVVRGAASKKLDLSDKTVLELSKGTPGSVKTTISPTMQAAAEKQVAAKPRASVVVMKASTGEILAVANNGKGFNVAFLGSLAPGSTMKVITSSLLIEKGLASADKEHPCPKYFTYGGWKFQNDDEFEIKKGTFKASFARSCNTAFISQAPELDNDSLTEQAQQVFGLSMDNWSVGVPTFDGSVPVQKAAQMGASLIGQGGVRMNPLNMASVSATVRDGNFHQPYLVPPSFDDRKLATASRTMSASTLGQLRELMKYTAQYGTAAEAMSGMSGDFGAKTGSAEVDTQEKANGWFTAYAGDLAAAGVVQAGGHGGDTAGPIVAALLKMG
ncbi:penicillin-binding transpeptidase domain-containing protein [Streptomyces acidiscabies]|uniref:Penicillin-binding transpeptidase domain-containing protein n=2 Tax=Streptomyces acidiscabies TaxID=42234 RepID=A0AAP6BJ35_9ACTN|nr:penicillin-binding transpeptidase domain-containing protein [Streptomyces acidiscabies]MBP5939043.1 penicillin-binding protein [Streptomyces sp. LBUM 1476]MBZ3910156.1 penicillin-binding protein [Streptomyces acidiscabies]MDX2965407.1 penicillin-binding transpeptidase domain-containing protein [Streptomyces acidiscabies]MDX3023671.1 penicillin-binding transpeptidase domain-containing protein [Streptomyces acidiscabies]MDX3789749.1 penicillin-binding transpeptidase domain-containing protein 